MPRVLQPLNAVIRLHDAVVERIAVRQEHIEIPVVVHVDELECLTSPVRMGRRVDHFLVEREVAPAAVDVGDHVFQLLGQHRDEIQVAVVVQICRDHVNAAVARIDEWVANCGCA